MGSWLTPAADVFDRYPLAINPWVNGGRQLNSYTGRLAAQYRRADRLIRRVISCLIWVT